MSLSTHNACPTTRLWQRFRRLNWWHYSRPTDSVSSRIRRSSASLRRCVPTGRTPGGHLPPFQKPRLWDHHGQSDGCNPGQIRQPCPQRLLAHHHAQRGSLRPSPSQIHMGVQGETRRHAPKADSAFRGCSLVKQVWTTTRRLLRQCARRPHGVFLLTQHAAGAACAAWIGSPPTFRATSSMERWSIATCHPAPISTPTASRFSAQMAYLASVA